MKRNGDFCASFIKRVEEVLQSDVKRFVTEVTPEREQGKSSEGATS